MTAEAHVLYIRVADRELDERAAAYVREHGATWTELVLAALREYLEAHDG